MEILDTTQADQDREIALLDKELTGAKKDILIKMDKNDAKTIWTHMQRFAYYDDLKDLNDKFLPELAKFESTIIGFKADNEKQCLMMRDFDETLAQKGSKNQIQIIQNKIEEDCATKKEQADFISKMEELNTSHEQQIAEQ